LPRPPQDPQIRIDEILDATELLVSTKGYRKTTISDIAGKLGVAQGMLYYYFKSKDEIIEAVMFRQLSSLLIKIEKVVYSDMYTATEQIEVIINIIIKIIEHDAQDLIQSMFREEKFLPIQKKIFNRTILCLKPYLLRIIEKGNQAGSFHVTNPNITIDFFFSILRCLSDALCEDNRDELPCRLRMTEYLVESLFGMPKNTIQLSC